MKIYIHALNSCGMRNVNVWRYRDYFIANGHEIVSLPALAEAVLVWTCGFRNDVRQNSLLEIKRCRKEYNAEVIVAGCVPDIDRELLTKYFKGQIINWRDEEEKLAETFGSPNVKLSDIPLTLFKEQQYEDETLFRKENQESDVPYVGRFIQLYISEGCKWECTYCSERLAFPVYRSFPVEDIVAACLREVERSGKKSVVLLGDSVGDYGCDLGVTLPYLIKRLREAVFDLKIAMQDLNPYHFLLYCEDMIELLKDNHILHLQIPYQSASDRILKLMKRPYNKRDLAKVFGTFNKIGFTEIDSHIIVGFPSETEKDFEESVQFAIDYSPKYMLINTFMESPGMPATTLPGKINDKTKRLRTEEAMRRFTNAGIICNSDGSELSMQRFKRLNKY